MGWLIGIGALVVVIIAISGTRDELRALPSTRNAKNLMLPGRPEKRDRPLSNHSQQNA